MATTFYFLCALMCLSYADPGAQMGGRLVGVPHSSICEGYWNAAMRFPFMQSDVPLWDNQYYMEVKDIENNRLSVMMNTPSYGQIRLLITPDASYQVQFGTCFKAPNNGLKNYLELARNTLVKVDTLPNNIDVYQGVAVESPSDNIPMAKVVHVDRRSNNTVYENWVLPNVRQKNADGSCPPDLSQFYGEIHYGYGGCKNLSDFVAQNGQKALDDLFAIPEICTPNNPATTDVLCWH